MDLADIINIVEKANRRRRRRRRRRRFVVPRTGASLSHLEKK
jgi:hypothetical protein